MTDLTDSLWVIGQYTLGLLKDNMVALGLKDVWYDDQEKIPRTPAACVEMGMKRRELNGAPRRTLVVLDAYIYIYHERITDSQENKLLNEKLAEQVEAVLHQDSTLNGLVVHSLVTTSEPGTVNRGGLIKATRLTMQCTSQVMLPYSAS